MPNSPRLLVTYADCAAWWIRSPTSSSQAWFSFMHIQYYVSDVNWISQISSLIQKTHLCPTKSISWQLGSYTATASHSFGEQPKWFQWSRYLRAERPQQAMHCQLLYYPLRPCTVLCSTQYWDTQSIAHGNRQQWSDCIISNKATIESLQAVKSEAVK